MKKLLLFLILFLFIFTFSAVTADVSAQDTIHRVNYTLEPDIHRNVEIEHIIEVFGVSNELLRSDIEIYIPYSPVEIISVKVDNRDIVYDFHENYMHFGFGKDLHIGEKVVISLKYNAYELGYIESGHKYYKILNPSLDSYSYRINLDSEHKQIKFINTPNQSTEGEFNDNIFLTLENKSEQKYIYTYEYRNSEEGKLYPIISESLGISQNLVDITGANFGYLESNKNYFLFPDERTIRVEGEFSYDDFVDLSLQEYIYDFRLADNFNDLNYQLLNIYKANINQEIIPQDLNYLREDRDLSQLEFALVVSDQFSKLGIGNRIVYGIVDTHQSDPSIHYWVQTLEEEQVIDHDYFFANYFGFESSDFGLLHLPFGIVDSSNYYNLGKIEYLQNNNIQKVDIVSGKVIDKQKSIFFNVNPTNDQNISVQVVNSGNQFGYVLGSSDSKIEDQLRNVLFLPGEIYTKKVEIESSNLNKSFDLNYIVGDEDKSNSFSISLIDKNQYYLKVFGIISAITIPLILILSVGRNYFIARKGRAPDLNLR